jgi:hypothetical protein
VTQHAPEAPSLTAINLHILKNLWLPDVEILDLKSFETHSVLSKLEGTEFKSFNNLVPFPALFLIYFFCFYNTVFYKIHPH